MGVRKFPLLVALLCNVALFTNGHPQSPGTNTYGYDGVLSSVGYGYINRLSALDIADSNRQSPAVNADRSTVSGNYDKLPANNTFKTNEKLINSNGSRDFQLNNANGNQPAIDTRYINNDKLPAISNIGYGNPNQLPAISNTGYDNPNQLQAIRNTGYDNPKQLQAISNTGYGNPNQLQAFSNTGYGNPNQLQAISNTGYGNPNQLQAIRNTGYGNPNQLQAISNTGYGNPNKLQAISNTGYGNPNQLPGINAYKYNDILLNDAYGYVNRPVYTTTQRPDFSNEPATTLPPLTPQQQIYVNMMNAVMGNPVPELDIAQAAALG